MNTAARILSPSQTRRELERIGHQPDGRLGQNFLVDGNIVRKSVRLAEIGPSETVVEVGAGLGTLTAALIDTGAIVHAIEFDPVLYRHLEETHLSTYRDQLHLHKGDAVKKPLAGLDPPSGSEFKIVANLPYAISTPWLAAVLAGPLPCRMVLMLQSETASRFTEPSGSKSFSAISIRLQSAYRPSASHRVSRNCFYPRPEVDSTLIRLDLRPDPVLLAPNTRELIRWVFQQRRKQIGSLLKSVNPDLRKAWTSDLESAGLSTKTRPEAIPLEQWHQLDALVRAMELSGSSWMHSQNLKRL
jgi:16S rRNA (adenine1518-N6/adenine1519-N6)-dimethyltransferase